MTPLGSRGQAKRGGKGRGAADRAAETTDTLLPLLDLSDAAVKRLIHIAKKRGYVTHDQVKSLSEDL